MGKIKKWLWLIVSIIVIGTLSIWIILEPGFWFNIWVIIEPWLWLIISIISIYVIYKVLIFLIKRYVQKSEKIPKDATNGLILIIRIVAVIAILFVLMPALSISSEILMDISTIIATGVGIASTLAVSNLVAGIYMFLANPYAIGDFISVNNAIEGVVKEIGLNYTKLQDIAGTVIQIPNNKMLSSNIANFNITHVKRSEGPMSFEEKFVSVLGNIMIEDEIVHYVFDMEIALDMDSKETIEILDSICERWTEKFGFKPQYFFKNLAYRAVIQWALMAEEPETIMNLKDDFLEDVWFSIYKFKKEMN